MTSQFKDLNGKPLFKPNGKNDNVALADALFDIVMAPEQKEYWGLTVRSVFYQAVTQQAISNCLGDYERVSRILSTLRRNDYIPWDAIEDHTRRTTEKRGNTDLRDYINLNVMDSFDRYSYRRCYVQNQENYVELVIEKDAISSVVDKAAYLYCTRVNVIKGQPSATIVKEMATRFKRAKEIGQNPMILYLGDLDPSGVQIPRSLESSLSTYHEVDVDLRRIALNPDQVERYKLLPNLIGGDEGVKSKDSNAAAFRREFGDLCYEIDALNGAGRRYLGEIVECALESVYDMEDFARQQAIEADERNRLERCRPKIEAILREECFF
jgi:hypothetical protein